MPLTLSDRYMPLLRIQALLLPIKTLVLSGH